MTFWLEPPQPFFEPWARRELGKTSASWITDELLEPHSGVAWLRTCAKAILGQWLRDGWRSRAFRLLNTALPRGHMRGSCWAFSTVGSLEGRVAIAAGNLQQFSELQLVDCGKYFGISDAKEA